jgi:hypothetical protein
VTAPDRVVLVVGAPLAGVGGVVAALRARLPDARIVDGGGPGLDRAPDAVLAVVSAAAPVTRSEWARVEHASARTDLLVAVVAKIDAHWPWRDVMAADRERVQRWGGRGSSLPWVGVAAAPDLGDPTVDELVDLLRDRLADPDLDRRNRQCSRPAARRSVGPSAVELRWVLQHTRLQLLRHVRDRTSALRAELRAAASAVPAGGCLAFERTVLARAARFDLELDGEITRAVSELGLDPRPVAPPEGTRRLASVDVGRVASSSRRLEGRLTTVLGIGFGLGVALASSRLVAGVAPGLSLAGLAAGAIAGAALVVWVVRARRLLHDRASLDRWVAEVVTTLRWHGEAMVAERLLGAESGGGTTRAQTADENVTDQYEW